MTELNTKLFCGILAAFVFASLSIVAYSQPSAPNPRPNPAAIDIPSGEIPAEPRIIHFGGDTSEKSIVVDGNVNLSLCVTHGNLKVNGWNRNEVRIFVKDGSKIGFKVLQKDAKTQSPVWITVMGLESVKSKNPTPSECFWGDEIEIDVPVNATINIKGQETETSIDTVRRANVKNIGGDISLRNVADGIVASTYRGGLTVENSKGGIVLESTTGNILVFEAGPSEIGDIFKAKTNSGTISLQRVEHRQIEVNSISGSVMFNGTILSGGSYGFSTSNGAIRLTLPQTSSCTISASYGFGSFNSELPIKILTENIHEGPVKSIVGTIGTGDATLKLTTNNGSISIKKQ